MARKNKLRKFAEIRSFSNVYECYDPTQPGLVGKDMQPVDLKGRWHEQHFQNDHPITLELACGAGEYTIGLARLFPERNFIGVDVKGNRLHSGAKEAVLDRREGLADKFIVTYDHNDSIEVYRFDKSTGTDAPGSSGSVVVLPNPFRETLQVKMPEAADFRLTLFSVDGRLVRTQEFFQENHGAMTGAGLAAGVYFLQIEGGKIREVIRVVKME